MRDSTDYYNLLTDTLRSGHHQISKIYHKIPEARREGKYINIRTGYLMGKKSIKDKNYKFYHNFEFPLCYNLTNCGFAKNEIIQKIFKQYEIWLKLYEKKPNDDDYLKYIVDKEINKAKNNFEMLNHKNYGKNDFILFNKYNEEEEEEEESEENEKINEEGKEEDYEENSFIEKDEKEKKNKKLKKGVKLEEEIEEDQIQLSDDLENNNEEEEQIELNEELENIEDEYSTGSLLLNNGNNLKGFIVTDSEEEEKIKKKKEKKKKEKL